jgi:hypothetical protein
MWFDEDELGIESDVSYKLLNPVVINQSTTISGY